MIVGKVPSADDAYAEFCRMIRRQAGLDLGAYKRGQMERRILAMAQRAGVDGLREYWQLLRRDPAALRDFLDRVTINVSEFLRNPEKYEELRTLILPALLDQRRSLTVWSAGCSYGAEPYSLRMLLHQLTPSRQHRILATDIDRGILARAKEGRFTETDLKNVPAAWRERYFTREGDAYVARPLLRDGVTFTQQDLLRDAFPEDIDLILCRNVAIYFTEEAKAGLFRRFSAALRPGGYLLVGSTERIGDAQEIGLVPVRTFIYQRPVPSA